MQGCFFAGTCITTSYNKGNSFAAQNNAKCINSTRSAQNRNCF